MEAAIPETWPQKLMIPPTLPTSPRRAMKEGSDQATGRRRGKTAERNVIQMRACEAVRVSRAQNAQTERRAPDQDGAANSALAEATLHEEVDQKSADREVRRGGKSHGTLV
jgi:hypothetical protein